MSLAVSDPVLIVVIPSITQVVILLINGLILRRVGEAKHITSLPRRFVYDQQQKIIGSVPDERSELSDYQPIREGSDATGRRWEEPELPSEKQ